MPCRACHAPIGGTDRFCRKCGEPLPNDPDPRTVEVDVGRLTELREEKERVSGALHSMLEQAQERNLTPEERRDWSSGYARWRDLTFQITKMMDSLSPRAPDERRRESGPHMAAQYLQPPDGERREGDDRRDPFWNRAP
jgi:hypothetical protein